VAFRFQTCRMWLLIFTVARIRRMPIDDTTIKTSLRLPKTLHAELERAAAASTLTLNGEMVFRLQHNPRDDNAKAILALINERDTALVDSLRKQMATVWGALDRADGVLERVAVAMARVSGEGDAAVLKHDVEFARELIGAIRAHR